MHQNKAIPVQVMGHILVRLITVTSSWHQSRTNRNIIVTRGTLVDYIWSLLLLNCVARKQNKTCAVHLVAVRHI
jgi:hypothetical protein